jgi:hypothetical protein
MLLRLSYIIVEMMFAYRTPQIHIQLFSTLPNKVSLDVCDLTKTAVTSHTTNERMFSSWVVQSVPLRVYAPPPSVACTAKHIIVTFNTIYVLILTYVTLQTVTAAYNNITAISLITKTEQ